MQDGFGRAIDYLRISITDRCNFRCLYCMPEEGAVYQDRGNILTFEEILRIAAVTIGMGIRRFRVTGGEPLVRKGAVAFLTRMGELPGLQDLALTSNGLLLAPYAADLARAGVKRVNISIDSLRPDRFARITRGGDLDRVWAGLEAALAAGLTPVKVNVVLLDGFNDDEIEDFALLTREYPLDIRFIELMPLGEAVELGRFLPIAEVRRRLLALGDLEPTDGIGAGPARNLRYPGAPGRIGLIAAVTEHFCANCNRIRLTADGRLLPCLGNEGAIDLRRPLRSGATDRELQEILAAVIMAKPERHWFQMMGLPGRGMSAVGG